MDNPKRIVLGEHYEAFIEHEVAAGRFASASDVLCAGLRLLEEHQQKVEILRQAIREGLDSGPADVFDVEAFVMAKEARPRDG